jgi:RNA polymerase sigma factor (sigma-70 family)
VGGGGLVTEPTLADRIRSGDRTAEKELVERFYRRVLLVARVRVGDDQIARAVAREAVLTAIRRLHAERLERHDELTGYVLATARRLMNPSLAPLRLEEAPTGWPVDPAADPSEAAEPSERIDLVRRSLDELDPVDRTILGLTMVEGMRPGEIADRLGMRGEMVCKREARALRRVREVIRARPRVRPLRQRLSGAALGCREVQDRELLEGYLVGRLGALEQEALEEHLFECDDCFREVETLRGIQERLSDLQHDVPRMATKPRATISWWWWTLGAAAVVTLSVAALIWWTAATARDRAAELPPELAVLVRVQPPYYEPMLVRGGSETARQSFESAMEHYVAGDFASAIPGLEEAAALDPGAADASFFLGACYLLTGRLPEGIFVLDQTVALGETPFLEESLMLLTKAHIQTGDLDAARQHLKALIEVNGDLEDEALQLEEAIQKRG